jgi:hypothetical protein
MPARSSAKAIVIGIGRGPRSCCTPTGIEAPGSDLDSGLGRLRRLALALAHEPLHALCDQLSARMPPGSTDDIALLARRLPVR